MKGLYEFLVNAELQQYCEGFKETLKVTSIDQIKYVDDEDLAGVGMSKPEIRRLRQLFKKECPQNALDKLRKINLLSSKSPEKVSSSDTSWFGSRSLGKDGNQELSNVHSMSTSSLLRRVERSESARLSLRPRRKLNSALIGRPESDIRHVSHIGYDGAVFGDVSQYGDLSDQLPLRPSSARCIRSDMTSSCISLPVSDDCMRDLHYSRDSLQSNQPSEFSDDDSLSDFQLPDFSIDLGCSLMDEVMQALGMMSNGDSYDCTKDDKKPAVVNTMHHVIDGSDDDSSDTATETGGSDRETETATTPTTPSDFAIGGFAKRPPNANIRAPRGIPGMNKGVNGVDRILIRDKPPESVSSDSAAETNPLRRLRENHLMFSH